MRAVNAWANPSDVCRPRCMRFQRKYLLINVIDRCVMDRSQAANDSDDFAVCLIRLVKACRTTV
jgi:hypothetical protein